MSESRDFLRDAQNLADAIRETCGHIPDHSVFIDTIVAGLHRALTEDEFRMLQYLPDAFLALRTDPSTSVGRRIMQMLNGTMLRVLRRNQDGWWYVQLVETGREGWALSRGHIVAENAPYQDPQYEHDAICRGVLTVNRTEQASDNAPDDGTRLIRADHINNSCLFYKQLDVGKQILAACQMGYWCEVRATVNSVESDVSYIVSVHSVSKRPDR
jgi:hypothetical protein